MAWFEGYAILRQRDYRRFYLGHWISQTGTWMQSATQGWLLIQLTGSPMALGLLGAAASAPLLVLVLVGGLVSDRADRRRVILVTQFLALIQAATMAWLTLAGHIQPWQVIALAAVLGTIQAFDIPARQAFLVELVGAGAVPNAVALNSSALNIARVIGPAIAGVVVAAVGEGYCFLINAASYIAVLWSLATIRAQYPVSQRAREKPRAALLDGLRYVRHHTAIAPILFLVGAISAVGVPYRHFLPDIARTVLGATAWQYGLLMAAAGIGASAGGLVLAGLQINRDRYVRLLPIGAMAFGVALLCFTTARSYWLAMLWLTLVGAGGIVYFNCSNSAIQLHIEDRYRGRVMSVYTLMHQGTSTFGNLLLGVLAARWGTPMALACGAVLCLVATVLFIARPAVRPAALTAADPSG